MDDPCVRQVTLIQLIKTNLLQSRRKWRHDVTDTTNLLQLQGVVLKDLTHQLSELQVC